MDRVSAHRERASERAREGEGEHEGEGERTRERGRERESDIERERERERERGREHTRERERERETEGEREGRRGHHASTASAARASIDPFISDGVKRDPEEVLGTSYRGTSLIRKRPPPRTTKGP